MRGRETYDKKIAKFQKFDGSLLKDVRPTAFCGVYLPA